MREPTEMELRVAEALDPDAFAECEQVYTPDGYQELQATALEQARSAIRAMREPTREMCTIGEESAFMRRREERKWAQEVREKTGGLPSWESTEALAAWQAMIDAASPPDSGEG